MDSITRQKISNSLKGKKKSSTHRKKISFSMKGKSLSEAHKKKISESLKRKKDDSQPITIRLGNKN